MVSNRHQGLGLRDFLLTFLIWSFVASVADSSFFILRHKRFLVYLMVYVNDIVLTSNFRSFLQSLIHQLSAEFELKDLGPPLFPWVTDYKIYKRPFSPSDQVCS